MRSAKEADSIYVLDTGSTDDSVERLRQLGALVEEKKITPWRFDAARNESLRLIPPDTDICVCVDLDEVFHPGWRKRLEAVWQRDITRARYRYTWSFQPDGSEGVVFWADKIHQYGAYRWHGAVHEVLEYVGSGEERFADAEGVQLDHHPDPKKSRGQYLPLLELAVAEEPENDRNCHYLGREYYFHGEWEKAITVLQQHLRMPQAVWADERCASMRYLSRCCKNLGRYGEAEAWLYRAVAEAPHLREPYLELAHLLFERRSWDGVIFFVRQALAITQRPRTYICEAYAWGAFPYDLLSLGLYHAGRYTEAAEAVKQALALAPQEERLQNNLAVFEKAIKSRN